MKYNVCFVQGVVTAAISLLETLAQRSPDEYKGCVPLAVSRLSRVIIACIVVTFSVSKISFRTNCASFLWTVSSYVSWLL